MRGVRLLYVSLLVAALQLSLVVSSSPSVSDSAESNPKAELESTLYFLAQVLAYPLGIFFCFVALAIVCDDYLASSLEKLVETYNIPHDVASATFLALGSSAPEISINCVATAHGKVNMSLGAVLGSGIIAYTVIPAACVLVSKGQVLKLETVPLVRDVLFYSVSIVAFVYFTSQGSFDASKNSFLLALFAVYLIALVVLGKLYHGVDDGVDQESRDMERESLSGENEAVKTHREEDSIDAVSREKRAILHKYKTEGDEGVHYGYGATTTQVNAVALEGQKELEDAEDSFFGCLALISWPLRMLFKVTIPPFCPVEKESDDIGDDDEAGIEIGSEWPFTMVVSLVYVCLFSEFVLVLTSGFADVIGLPHHIAGLTILALGAQVPDLFASVSVAKKGEGPSSIANAVGSQIINILVGVGFPFLIYNLTQGEPIQIDMGAQEGGKGLQVTGVLLFVLVATFVGLCFRHVHSGSHVKSLRKPALTGLDAVILGALYVGTLFVLLASEAILK